MDAGEVNAPLKRNYTKTGRAPAPGFGGQQILGLTGNKKLSEKEKLDILAREFESIFLNQMLKTMRSTVQKSELINGGSSEEIFTAMLDEEMARQMAYKQNNGLSSALVEQLSSMIKGADGGKETNPTVKPTKNR